MANAYVLAGGAIAEVIDVALEALGLRKDKDAFLHRQTESARKYFEKALISAAFEHLGIEFDEDEPVNSYTVTEALNRSVLAGTGLEFTNLFNPESVKSDITSYALGQINERSGGQLNLQSLTTRELKRQVKALLMQRLREQIEAGAGSMLDAIPDSSEITAMIASYEAGLNKPLKAGADAESNRQRQATYRAGHTKHWVSK